MPIYFWCIYWLDRGIVRRNRGTGTFAVVRYRTVWSVLCDACERLVCALTLFEVERGETPLETRPRCGLRSRRARRRIGPDRVVRRRLFDSSTRACERYLGTFAV